MTTTSTTETEPLGLMAFTATISPPSYTLRYQQWHNCEHIPERVLLPGFLEGRRYRLFPPSSSTTTPPDPRFLMFYHTATPSTLSSEPYLNALATPTPWTLESLSHFRSPIRDVYGLLACRGTRGPLAAPYIVSLRFDFAPQREQAGEQLYVEKWVERVGQGKNVQRARLYRADKGAGNLATSERKQHGGGPGEEGWLVLVELVGPPSAADADGWEMVVGEELFGEADREVGDEGRRLNEVFEAGWLEMVHVKDERV